MKIRAMKIESQCEVKNKSMGPNSVFIYGVGSEKGRYSPLIDLCN